MAATVKVVLGSIAFGIFWALAVFPSAPCLPIGRTGGSLLGAVLMVIFQVMTPDQAFAAIDLPILGLLFGTMMVGLFLERADMFKYVAELLSWKSQGAKDLICRVCVISAISSAFFTNDTSCVVLTELVLTIARKHNLPPHPFLLALSSSANIGSAATPIGNPQNLVIAVQSKIRFMEFLFGIFPAMLLGVFVNGLIILCMYWRLLSIPKDGEDLERGEVSGEDVNSHKLSPTTLSHLSPSSQKLESPCDGGNVDTARDSSASREGISVGDSVKDDEPSEEKRWVSKRWRRIFWKASVYIVTMGMLVSLVLGMNMAWTAITAALALVVLDFKEARPCLEKVSYLLLVLFCGMFITVEGFNLTGIPSSLWELLEPYSRIDHAAGVAVLALVIIFLSNFASNVPTVLLLGGRVAASAGVISGAAGAKKAWLIMAWVSTVAGNLTLVGSAANLIVCEQASNVPHIRYTLSFWTHFLFGVPSTLIVTTLGLALLLRG